MNASFNGVTTVIEKENDRLDTLSNHDGKFLNRELPIKNGKSGNDPSRLCGLQAAISDEKNGPSKVLSSAGQCGTECTA